LYVRPGDGRCVRYLIHSRDAEGVMLRNALAEGGVSVLALHVAEIVL